MSEVGGSSPRVLEKPDPGPGPGLGQLRWCGGAVAGHNNCRLETFHQGVVACCPTPLYHCCILYNSTTQTPLPHHPLAYCGLNISIYLSIVDT